MEGAPMPRCPACGREIPEDEQSPTRQLCLSCGLAEGLVAQLTGEAPFGGPHHEPGKTRLRYQDRLGAVYGAGAEVTLTNGRLGWLSARRAGDRVQLQLMGPDGSRLQAEGTTPYGALRALQADLEQQERRLRSCGLCSSFRFSAMSAQMSGETKGYCTRGKQSPMDCGREDVVSVFDVCEAFDWGPEHAWGY